MTVRLYINPDKEIWRMTFHFEFTVALMLLPGAVSDCAAFTVGPSLHCLHIHLFFSPMSDLLLFESWSPSSATTVAAIPPTQERMA